MRTTFFKFFASLAAVAIVGWAISISHAAKPAGETKSENKQAESAPLEIDMFAGMSEGKLEVKYMAVDQSRMAKLFIKNKTKQPLNVRLPDAFGAVPVLAQIGGGNRGGGGNQQSQQGQNQSTTGGGGQQGGGQQGGGGGGLFNIAPEKVAEIKTPTLCLNHGLREPTIHSKYDVKPLEDVIADERIRILVVAMVKGEITQHVSQAAAWHYANNMSWEELAAKKVGHLGGGSDEPYFQPNEIRLAMQADKAIVKKVQENLAKKSKTDKSEKSDKVEYKNTETKKS